MSLKERMAILNPDVEQTKNHILANTEKKMTEQESKDYYQGDDFKRKEEQELENLRKEKGGLAGLTDKYATEGYMGFNVDEDIIVRYKDVPYVQELKGHGKI